MLPVTHDVDEALVLAERVIVLRGQPGRVHAEVRAALPRPGDRSSATFQSLRRPVITALDPSETPAERAERRAPA